MEFKWSHFGREVILWGVRWYVAYPISYLRNEVILLKGYDSLEDGRARFTAHAEFDDPTSLAAGVGGLFYRGRRL